MSVCLFDFEELIADMLGISDDDRNDDESIVEERFFDKFNIEFVDGYEFACQLMKRTPAVSSVLSGELVQGFANKNGDVLLMKDGSSFVEE
jgi:hypothetical protein|tara:strand:- start:57008 stop:57280 length:273 start_codon:yes stop_codon:yes gene_type:complete